MAAKKAIPPIVRPETPDKTAPAKPLTLDALFKFIESHGAKRVQLIRTTGTGRLDATINPLNTGNILILIEIDPTTGHIT